MKKKNGFQKNILLTAKLAASALVAGVIATASIGSAWAYFTTYTSASGGYAINLNNETSIVEDYTSHTKELRVTNDGTYPVYVRAKAFSGSQYELRYSGEGWKPGSEGYWYYDGQVPGITVAGDGSTVKSSTSELFVRIIFPGDEEDEQKREPEYGDTVDVVVIYESIPVQYDENGNPLAPEDADWSVDEWTTGTTEGGNE